MSIDMYVSASKSQASSVSSMCKQQTQGYEEAQRAINSFVLNSPFLTGKAYISAKAYFASVLSPLAKGGALLAEAIEEAVKKFPDEYVAQVDSGDLKQSELEEKIRQAERLLFQAKVIRGQLKSADTPAVMKLYQLTANLALIGLYGNMKKDFEEKLQKLLTFHASSPAIFSEIASLQQAVNQGISQTATAWNAATGTFTIPKDLSWAKIVNEKWTMRNLTGKNEKEYIQVLQDQFGFDEETAKQIYKIKEGIDDKFPKLTQNEKDYLLLRILGEISYSGFAWDSTAGSLGSYFYNEVNYGDSQGNVKIPKNLNEILEDLGLSSKEIQKLCYSVRIQHLFSGGDYQSAEDLMKFDKKNGTDNYAKFKKKAEEAYGSLTDEEFANLWNTNREKFEGKADFTHQSITMATNMYDNYLRLANVKGLSHEYTNELSGWRGDTTTQAEAQPSIGNDDYKADLDAVNITKLMKEKRISYIEASNQYYNDISSGKYTRAEKFKKNVGFDYVKSEIIADLAPKYEYTIGDTKYQTKYKERPDSYNTERELTEKEKLNYVKEHYPASYDFINSLENNQNEYTNYASEGK